MDFIAHKKFLPMKYFQTLQYYIIDQLCVTKNCLNKHLTIITFALTLCLIIYCELILHFKYVHISSLTLCVLIQFCNPLCVCVRVCMRVCACSADDF